MSKDKFGTKISIPECLVASETRVFLLVHPHSLNLHILVAIGTMTFHITKWIYFLRTFLFAFFLAFISGTIAYEIVLGVQYSSIYTR